MCISFSTECAQTIVVFLTGTQHAASPLRLIHPLDLSVTQSCCDYGFFRFKWILVKLRESVTNETLFTPLLTILSYIREYIEIGLCLCPDMLHFSTCLSLLAMTTPKVWVSQRQGAAGHCSWRTITPSVRQTSCWRILSEKYTHSTTYIYVYV